MQRLALAQTSVHFDQGLRNSFLSCVFAGHLAPKDLVTVPYYFRSTAVSVISGTLANALDSGQSCFAAAAIF